MACFKTLLLDQLTSIGFSWLGWSGLVDQNNAKIPQDHIIERKYLDE
ncbi:hypothetical protein OAK98_01845 [Mariniblastus sp.]|nr:hypothetical protein [Mariniblastus sp.]